MSRVVTTRKGPPMCSYGRILSTLNGWAVTKIRPPQSADVEQEYYPPIQCSLQPHSIYMIIKFTKDSHPSYIPYLSIQIATFQLSLLRFLEHPYLHLACYMNFVLSWSCLYSDHDCIDQFFWMQAKKQPLQVNQFCPALMVRGNKKPVEQHITWKSTTI